MCYSGRCRWEDHMGDCRFPHNKVVREKYPKIICDIPECEEDEEYLKEVYDDIQNILKEEKMKNMTLKKEVFEWEEFKKLSDFADSIGQDNVVNIIIFGLQLQYVIFYWE